VSKVHQEGGAPLDVKSSIPVLAIGVWSIF
jgi:hypothetical protein